MKFKVGDKVKRTAGYLEASYAIQDTSTYVVTGVQEGWLKLEGSENYTYYHENYPFWAEYFELVEDEYLSPQEVLQCIKDGVYLECMRIGKWLPELDPKGITVDTLLSAKFRIPPKPKTVTINSIEVPKPIDKDMVHTYDEIFSITTLTSVNLCTQMWEMKTEYPVWATRADAEAALKAIQAALT